MRSRRLTLLITLCTAIAALSLGPPATAQTTSQFEVIATVAVTTNPFGVTVAPDGQTAWVANSGPVVHGESQPGAVTIIDTASLAIQSVVPVGRFPEDIAFARAGSQAFVTNSSDATVSVIDAGARTVTQTVDLAPVPMEFPSGIIASADSAKVFVTSVGAQVDSSLENIAILDNSDPGAVALDGSIRVEGATGRPALTPDGSLLLVPRGRGHSGPPEILLVDPATDQLVGSIRLSSSAGAVIDVAVTPDGRFAYASLFNLGGPQGGVWVIDLSTRSTVTVVPTPDERTHGIGMSPDGRFVFATNFSLGQVSVISTASNQLVQNVAVGASPNEVAVTPDSSRAFVTNQGDATVSVISIPAP
jgi:YVTN family beta-propeller protein